MEIYSTALLSALQMAIDRKQELHGLNGLLSNLCLPLIATPSLSSSSSNDRPFSISLRIVGYLCTHTDAVWSVCAQFAVQQLEQFETTIPDDEDVSASDYDDQQMLKISAFKQLCEFILMLLDCTDNVKTDAMRQWIHSVHRLCCHDKFLWDTPYLKVLDSTIFFNLYAKETTYRSITAQERVAMTGNVLDSIAAHSSRCTLQLEHLLLLQWIGAIRFNTSTDIRRTDTQCTDTHESADYAVARHFRECIMLGLQSGIKVMEKISIQLLHRHHSHILVPGHVVADECIGAVVALWDAMYEERTKTISNMLTAQIPKILESLQLTVGLQNESSCKLFNVVEWVQSILHLIWKNGIEHQNKAVRRATLYCLLAWDSM